MNNKTKLFLGVSCLGVAAYLVWKKMNSEKKELTLTDIPAKTNFTGVDLLTGMPSAVGNRQ